MQEDYCQNGVFIDPHGLRMAGHHQGMGDIGDFSIGEFWLFAKLVLMVFPGIIQGLVGFTQAFDLSNGL